MGDKTPGRVISRRAMQATKSSMLFVKTGGEGGIRTRGDLRHTAFRERHHQPLGHLSMRNYSRLGTAHTLSQRALASKVLQWVYSNLRHPTAPWKNPSGFIY